MSCALKIRVNVKDYVARSFLIRENMGDYSSLVEEDALLTR